MINDCSMKSKPGEDVDKNRNTDHSEHPRTCRNTKEYPGEN